MPISIEEGLQVWDLPLFYLQMGNSFIEDTAPPYLVCDFTSGFSFFIEISRIHYFIEIRLLALEGRSFLFAAFLPEGIHVKRASL